MTNPPQDALDLYAWGVEYCEQRGIPLGAIRVHWEYDQINREGWQFEVSLGWEKARWSLYNDGPNLYPLGFYLSFDCSDDAAEFGLEGVRPYTNEDTVYVWVQPGHEFRNKAVTVDYQRDTTAVVVLCLNCNHEQICNHKGLLSLNLQAPSFIPPHIQLPACIKRHSIQYDESHSKGLWQTAVSDPLYICCASCKKQWEFKRKDAPTLGFPAEWIKTLGRCSGIPIQTLDSPNQR